MIWRCPAEAWPHESERSIEFRFGGLAGRSRGRCISTSGVDLCFGEAGAPAAEQDFCYLVAIVWSTALSGSRLSTALSADTGMRLSHVSVCFNFDTGKLRLEPAIYTLLHYSGFNTTDACCSA